MSAEEQEQVEKKYDPLDSTLKFVDRPDDLDPFSKTEFLFHWACWCLETKKLLLNFLWKIFISITWLLWPLWLFSWAAEFYMFKPSNAVSLMCPSILRCWPPQSRDVLRPRRHCWLSNTLVSKTAGGGILWPCSTHGCTELLLCNWLIGYLMLAKL